MAASEKCPRASALLLPALLPGVHVEVQVRHLHPGHVVAAALPQLASNDTAVLMVEELRQRRPGTDAAMTAVTVEQPPPQQPQPQPQLSTLKRKQLQQRGPSAAGGSSDDEAEQALIATTTFEGPERVVVVLSNATPSLPAPMVPQPTLDHRLWCLPADVCAIVRAPQHGPLACSHSHGQSLSPQGSSCAPQPVGDDNTGGSLDGLFGDHQAPPAAPTSSLTLHMLSGLIPSLTDSELADMASGCTSLLQSAPPSPAAPPHHLTPAPAPAPGPSATTTTSCLGQPVSLVLPTLDHNQPLDTSHGNLFVTPAGPSSGSGASAALPFALRHVSEPLPLTTSASGAPLKVEQQLGHGVPLDHAPNGVEETQSIANCPVMGAIPKPEAHLPVQIPPNRGKLEGTERKTLKSKFAQQRCKRKENGRPCNRKTRFYCSCKPDLYLCRTCQVKHSMEEAVNDALAKFRNLGHPLTEHAPGLGSMHA